MFRSFFDFFFSSLGIRAGSLSRAFVCGVLSVFLVQCGKNTKSDTVVVYSAGPPELAETICRTFEKETGVTTRLFSATTGEIMAKLKAEEFHPQADVVILAGQTAAEVLKEEKLRVQYQVEGGE